MLENWLMWFILGLFVVIYGLRAIRDARHVFSPALLVSALTFGVFVKSYFEFEPVVLAVFLDQDYYFMTLCYTALCLLAFCLMQEYGRRRPLTPSALDNAADRLPVYLIVSYVSILGVVGFAAQLAVASLAGGVTEYYSVAHGGAADVSGMSAYVHGLPNFMWPALIIGYVTLKTRSMPPALRLVLMIVTGAVGLALFAHTFLFGNRNGIIRFCLIFGAVYAFVNRPTMAKSLPLFVGLAFGGICVSVVAEIRQHLHLGSEVSLVDALGEYFTRSKDAGGIKLYADYLGGHELFINVATVQATWVTGEHDYGATYIYPLINFIPRAWWPEKPYATQFSIDFFSLIPTVTGWQPGYGSAIGAVGESFLALSWFGFIPWAVVGFFSGRYINRCWTSPTVMNLGLLSAVLVGLVFWATQTFVGFFNGWFFTVAPFYGLRLLARVRTFSAPPRRVTVTTYITATPAIRTQDIEDV